MGTCAIVKRREEERSRAPVKWGDFTKNLTLCTKGTKNQKFQEIRKLIRKNTEIEIRNTSI